MVPLALRREDMQAYLPVFPPWFPVQALLVLVFQGAFSLALLRGRERKHEALMLPCICIEFHAGFECDIACLVIMS